MKELEFGITTTSRIETIQASLAVLQPYYKLKSKFALKVLALLIERAAGREVVIENRKELEKELGCSRQQFQNAMTTLIKAGIVRKCGVNSYLLGEDIPVPGLGGIAFKIVITTT